MVDPFVDARRLVADWMSQHDYVPMIGDNLSSLLAELCEQAAARRIAALTAALDEAEKALAVLRDRARVSSIDEPIDDWLMLDAALAHIRRVRGE